MKKILFVAVVTLTFFITGCGNNEKKYEKLMEEYGKDYFEKYMPIQGFNEVEITISMLKNANENGNENYDLKKLEKCDDTTKVKFTLNPETNEIKDSSFELNCK